MAQKKRASSKKRSSPAKSAKQIRVIVEMARPREEEPTASMRAAAMADPLGFQVDAGFEPIPVESTPDGSRAMSLEEAGETSVIVRGTIASDQKDALAQRPGVEAVWEDTPIAAFQVDEDTVFVEPKETAAMGACPIPPCDCAPGTPKGTLLDVAKYLGADQIWAGGNKGQGIVVGVVDGGVTTPSRVAGGKINGVIDGPKADWGKKRLWGGHGEMCATDVLGIAPSAKLYDMRLPDGTPGETLSALISDALAAFQWAINRHKADGTPQILTNSWGIYKKSWDPVYATNANHPFTRKVVDAVNEGIIVLFAAGNCGGTCPDGRCGGDNGPGKSIWGANGHPSVITVGAANTKEQLIGYSSQGPAALDPQKPDFCSISHFKGYFASDTGTSAACPIAAGVVALLKQCNKGLTPAAAKAVLKGTAKNIGPAGWDQHSGSGIIHAGRAHQKVCKVVTTVRCQRERALVIRYRDLYRRTKNKKALCYYYYWLGRYYCCMYRATGKRAYLCRCHYYLGKAHCCMYQITRNRRYLCRCYRYLGAAYCCLYQTTRNARYLTLCRRYQAAARRIC